MPQKVARTVLFAAIVWMIGFAWGSFVFMTPSLSSATPIPFVSTNPWISFPILIVWFPVTYFLARNYLRLVDDPRSEGTKLGFVFAAVNFGLDLAVVVILLGAGFSYFVSLTVIAGYALLIVLPRAAGRAFKKS